jgi:hypothetical protein
MTNGVPQDLWNDDEDGFFGHANPQATIQETEETNGGDQATSGRGRKRKGGGSGRGRKPGRKRQGGEDFA